MSFEGVITRKHPTDLFLPDFFVVFRRLFPFLLCLRCVSPPSALGSSRVSAHCTVKSVKFSVDRLLSCGRLPESETEEQNNDYNSSLYCDGSTLVHISWILLVSPAKTYQNREEEKNATYRSRSRDYYGDALYRRTVT